MGFGLGFKLGLGRGGGVRKHELLTAVNGETGDYEPVHDSNDEPIYLKKES